MLLQFRFLNGYYGSTKNGNQKREQIRDWPPSPSRLFSAFTNAFYTYVRFQKNKHHDFQEDKSVLTWLENLNPPDIHYAEPINEDNAPNVFVPINEYEAKTKHKTGSSPLYPNKQARRFPSVHAASPYLYYQWTDVVPHPDFVKIIPYLDQLGTSKSMVVAKIVSEISESAGKLIHVTHNEEGHGIRLPCYYPGRSIHLDYAYDNEQKIHEVKFVTYCEASDEVEIEVSNRRQTILKLIGPHNVPGTHTSLLAHAVRSKLLHIAEKLNIAPNALIGKTHSPHMSFLSLPFVGFYGDGSIKGMNITIPNELDSQEIDQCQTILNEFIAQNGHFKYRDENWNLISFVEDCKTPQTLKYNTWNQPSSIWKTVTPSEINWKVNNEEYVYQLCEKLGLPVKFVQQSFCPLFKGVDSSMNYFKRNVVKGRHGGFLAHFCIEFEKRISGPLAVGNSANFGLGLLKPVREV
jgi:CRISPR-associated protein Csb2